MLKHQQGTAQESSFCSTTIKPQNTPAAPHVILCFPSSLSTSLGLIMTLEGKDNARALSYPAECGSADIASVIPAVIPISSYRTPVVVTHGSAGIGIPRRLSAEQGNHEICPTQPLTDGCGVTILQLQSSTPGLIKLRMETGTGICLSRGSNVLVVPQEVAEEVQSMGYVIEAAMDSIQTGRHFGMTNMVETIIRWLLARDAYKSGEYFLKLARDAGQPIEVQGIPIIGDFNLRNLRENHVP
ncbi:hypothetical protein BSKO_03837 [Bryopsis sp. KO-2023]|nr:hypothetical protein BSKO_03837 [Bryopsis sp. KO-2023]